MSASATVFVDGVPRSPAFSKLSWTKTASGGCLLGDMTVTDTDLAARISAGSKVLISTSDAAALVFDGEVRDPGARERNGRRAGQVSIRGSVASLWDQFFVLPYVVKGSGAWVQEDLDMSVLAGRPLVVGEASSSSDADGAGVTGDSLRLSMKQGPLLPWQVARARCTAFDDSDMTVAGFRMGMTAGFTTWTGSFWRFRVKIAAPGFQLHPVEVVPEELPDWYPTLTALAGVHTEFPLGQREIRVELAYTDPAGAQTEINSEYFRVNLHNLAVVGSRIDIDGSPQPLLTWANQAVPEQIVRDILGRSGVIDPQRARIDTTATRINSLHYDAPTAPGDVLSDVLQYEMDYRWIMHPSDTGLHPFTWGPWALEPRYVVSQDRGVYSESPREDEVYNAVAVQWRDEKGRSRITTTPIADPDVYPATRNISGRRMPPPVDLSSSVGSESDALRVGLVKLHDLANLRISATYGTAARVYDTHQGALVHPHQVEPGETVLVQETGGVHRITQSVCDGINGTANLTLGSPAKTDAQIVSIINRRRKS